MADPAESENQNLLPVQAYFDVDGEFQTFIGQGQPFYATVNPDQSGLHITNSTIDSTVIGGTTPSTGVFTDIQTTTGSISSAPTGPNSIVNQAYVDSVAQGLSFKQPANFLTTADITLSGLAVQAGGDWAATLTAGDRILVKNQTTAANNGIYVAASGAWARASDANTYDEYLAAYLFVLSGVSYGGSAWVCTNQPGGTLGVTPITFTQFSNNALYTAGTGLTLAGYQFSITPVGTAGTYGSASSVPVLTTNASGQVSSVTNTAIAIANTQVSGLGTMSTQNANAVAISGGNIDGTVIGGTTAAAVTGTTVTASTQFAGSGAGLTGTATSLSIGGNAATATTAGSATTATTATNLAGGAAGSVPYQASAGSTSMLAVGTNGQVLTVASGVPSWATPTTGTVTSVGGTGTVSGISLSGTVTSSGNLTLGGALDLSSPPAIGGTTPAAITGTTITANTKFVSEEYYAQSILGGNLRTSGGTSLVNWDGGGSGNVTVNGGLLANPSNKNVSLAPTGTGTVTINPATAGTMDNVAIGATTAANGTFSTLRFNTTLSVNGSTGTSGQVLTSSGTGTLPTWTTISSAAVSISDDTTTNATRYPLFADATSGTVATEYVSSTKYQFNPSTGVLTSTSFSGAGTGLTGTASSLSIGGNAATATSATTATNIAGGATGSVPYQTSSGATTLLAAGSNGQILTLAAGVPSWAAAPATGITVTDDTTTNATRYLTFTDATSGSITSENVSSTKLKYNPSTGNLTTPIVTASTNVTFQDASTQNTAATGFGFKNRIINGAMMIDQRNAGASVTPTNTQYGVDRWAYGLSQASKFTAQQSSTAPAGFINSNLITSSSAYSSISTDFFWLEQKIEGLNCADLGWGTANAATVTLSFWVRSSLTGTFGGSLTNSAVNRSYPFSFVINSANTWEQKSITIAGDTSGTWLTTNGVGIRVAFNLGSGSNYQGTANTWAGAFYLAPTGATSVVGTSGATFYITGVQLEKGSTATSFDYRPYGTELQLCQRYYETSTVYVISNTTAYTPFVFPYTTKRAAPTVTASGMPSGISGSNSGINNYSGYFNLSVLGSAIVTALVSAEL